MNNIYISPDERDRISQAVASSSLHGVQVYDGPFTPHPSLTGVFVLPLSEACLPRSIRWIIRDLRAKVTEMSFVVSKREDTWEGTIPLHGHDQNVWEIYAMGSWGVVVTHKFSGEQISQPLTQDSYGIALPWDTHMVRGNSRIVKFLSSLRVWITVLEITGILIVYTIESFLPSIVSLRDVMSSVKHSGNDSVCIELYESYEKIFLRSIEENYWNVREHSLPILWSTVHQ